MISLGFHPMQFLILLFLLPIFTSKVAVSQSIIPANDETNTRVTSPNSRQLNIEGGIRSGNNLFHSFEQFGLEPGEIANFLSSPDIRNILGRVTGGNASVIQGLIQVSGSQANLFLINPAGIIWGSEARLNVPASFTATTANGIGFGNNNWFNVWGENNWSTFVNSPSAFRFDAQNPGSLINWGQLAVNPGQQLILLGGTVISTGTLIAPEGTIFVQSVPGEKIIRIRQNGHLLNLELSAIPSSESITVISPLSLPELLTGSGVSSATEVTVNTQGQIVLQQGQTVEPGDIVIGTQNSDYPQSSAIITQTAILKSAHNLNLFEGQILTTGDLNIFAENTVRVRDSAINPFSTNVGGNLTIIGKENIDILALNLSNDAPFKARGDINLVSDGVISGDSRFEVGGDFRIIDTLGRSGTFVSLYDPIIRSNGDVILGDYTGASLKIEAQGRIIGEDITITQPDINLSDSTDPDAEILRSRPTLILRSGVEILSDSPNLNSPTLIDDNSFSQRPSSGNNITVGAISTLGGPVILESGGEIILDRIDTQGGEIFLSAPDNILVTRTLTSSGGNIEIITDNLLRVQSRLNDGVNASISSTNGEDSGSILIQHGGGSETLFIVGNSSTNGTADAIFTGSQNISPQLTIPVPSDGIFTQGNITIRTTPPPPVEPTPTPPVEPIPPPPMEPTPPPPVEPTPPPPVEPTPPPVLTPTPVPTPTPTPTPTPSPVPTPPFDFTQQDQESITNAIEGEPTTLRNSSNLESEDLDEKSILRIDSTLEFELSQNKKRENNQIDIQRNQENDLVIVNQNETKKISKNIPNILSEPISEERLELIRQDIFSSLENDQLEEAVSEAEQLLSWEYSYHFKPGMAQLYPGKRFRDIRESLEWFENNLNHKAAILYTFVRSHQLDLILVTSQKRVIYKKVKLENPEYLLKIVRKFQQNIIDPRQRNTENYLSLSQEIFQYLISPLESELKAQEIKTIMFAMDKGLRSLPLAALHDGQQFLIEKYSYSLIPSFSLLNTRYRSLKNAQVLAMGASEFTDQGFLPAVPVEMETITSEMTGNFFLNQEFTLNNFKSQRTEQPYRIIHLATHAEFKPGNPRNSYIQFWDVRLSLDNLRQLGWKWNNPPTELFVLSACRTALGDKNAELGFAGLAVQAGVSSAVASLWYADDLATLGLMTTFYQQLSATPIKAEALRQAQLALLSEDVKIESGQLLIAGRNSNLSLPPELSRSGSRIFSHPYYWANFTMIGSPW